MDGSNFHQRVRRMTAKDIGECMIKAEPRFREWFPYMDLQAMHDTCVANIDELNVLLIRTDNAFGCVTVDSTMQEPRLWAREEWAFGEVWEVVSIFKEMLAWSRRIGAFRFTFGSLTRYDFKPIAKRLGKFNVIEAYNFELEEIP